jgi:hypothetical protein
MLRRLGARGMSLGMRERWGLCLLGAWLMGSVIMIMVATRNFRLIDELLQGSPNTDFRALVESFGAARVRDTLRYLSSELNREYFQTWNVAQVVLGGASLLLIPRTSELARAWRLLAVSLLLVAGMLIFLNPQIVQIGRSLDFVPRDPPPPQLATFWKLHVAYTVLEVAKLVLVGLSAFWIARGGKPKLPREVLFAT